MAFSYYRCDWVHPHNKDPIIIYYEVDAEGDVPRMIEVFEGGRRKCISTADFVGRENELPGLGSLVEGDFRNSTKEMLGGGSSINDSGERITLSQSDQLSFDAEWHAHRF